jgi:hypothetical protein
VPKLCPTPAHSGSIPSLSTPFLACCLSRIRGGSTRLAPPVEFGHNLTELRRARFAAEDVRSMWLAQGRGDRCRRAFMLRIRCSWDQPQPLAPEYDIGRRRIL